MLFGVVSIYVYVFLCFICSAGIVSFLYFCSYCICSFKSPNYSTAVGCIGGVVNSNSAI